MPDEASAILRVDWLPYLRHCPVDDVIDSLKLLIPGHLFGSFALFGLEDDEVLEKIEQVAGFEPQQTPDRYFQWVVRIIGLRCVPPAFLIGVETQPAAPPVEMALDVVPAGVVEKHLAVAEFLLVRLHTEDIRRQEQGAWRW